MVQNYRICGHCKDNSNRICLWWHCKKPQSICIAWTSYKNRFAVWAFILPINENLTTLIMAYIRVAAETI